MEPIRKPVIVGGVPQPETRGSASRPVLIVNNPYDGEFVAEVSLATEADCEAAVAAAQRGFQQARRLTSAQRSDALAYVASALRKRPEHFAELIRKEAGKPIQLARAEVDRARMTFESAAEEAKRLEGTTLPLDLSAATAGRWGLVRRFPIGIVLAITPFNFPLNLVAHKLAPAMAAGNSFILKPALQTPLTAHALAELILESGYPPEAVSVIPCSNELAEGLVKDPRIAMLSFTGSAVVGWHLRTVAGRKKTSLELGGNAGAIVDAGADIDDAVRKLTGGAFAYAGQVCIKTQRLFVAGGIADEFEEKFCTAARHVPAGNPADAKTMIGPMISGDAADRVERWVAEAVAAGARVLVPMTRVRTMLSACVLADVPSDAKVWCEEVFGPVAVLRRFTRLDDAIDELNASRYGLQAAVFSNDISSIMTAYDRLDVGGVIVNHSTTFRVDTMPYGGVKDSGTGREGVRYAVEEMTEPRLLVL